MPAIRRNHSPVRFRRRINDRFYHAKIRIRTGSYHRDSFILEAFAQHPGCGAHVEPQIAPHSMLM
jgi:hypothetical protein